MKIPCLLKAGDFTRNQDAFCGGTTLKNILHWLDEYLEISICVVLMSIMTLVIFAQVVFRYALNNSLSWSEELARFIFIWLIYLGVSYGCKQMKHLKIDAALYIFPKKLRPWIMIIGDICVLCFAAYIAYTGFQLTLVQIQFTKYSSAMHCPMWVVNAAPCVGFALACIRQVQTILYRLKRIKEGDPLYS